MDCPQTEVCATTGLTVSGGFQFDPVRFADGLRLDLTMHRAPSVLAAVVLSASLTGCGGESEKEKILSRYPTCSDVWVVGKSLPADYEGCARGGKIKAASTLICKDGTEISTLDDRFWSVDGGPIKDAGSSGIGNAPDYAKAEAACG